MTVSEQITQRVGLENVGGGEAVEPMETDFEADMAEGGPVEELGLAELHKQLVEAKRRAAYFQTKVPFHSI